MLNIQAQKLMEKAKVAGLPPVFHLSVNEARKRMRAGISADAPEPVFQVYNTFVPCPGHSIGLRIYKPSDEKNLPAIVYFHGGGWVLNDLDTHDVICRSLANEVKVIVVSVDYRRAPEYPYPAPVEDAYSATEWVFANAKILGIDSTRIALAGDSSGATMATVVCLLSRDKKTFNVKFQLLAYPVTDYFVPGTASYKEMAEGYANTRDFMIWVWNKFLPGNANLDDPYLCPLRAKNLKNLPAAFVMTANYDPLRDEGEAYANKLAENGVKVTLKRYDDLMHGFFLQRKAVDSAEKAFEDAVLVLKENL